MDNLIILIPAYNELDNLKKILNNEFNFFIVDDCSTDGTEEFLAKNNFKYIKNKKNLGYEKTILVGMNYLAKNYQNITTLCTFDGDNEHPKNEIKRIYSYYKRKKIDLLVCNRKKQNRISESLLSILFFLKHGIKDPLTGMKFYNFFKLKKVLNLTKADCFLVDLLHIFLKKNYKVGNYSIITDRNLTNSKIGFNFNVDIKILKLIKYLF